MRDRESASRAIATTSQLTEYSTRICARRTEISTSTMSRMLAPAMTSSSLSIALPPGGVGRLRAPVQPALVLQHIYEHAQQHMDDVIERAHGGNGIASRHARPHLARHLFEPESTALKHDQRLDFRILQRKAPTENLQCAAVHADEAGSGIAHRLAENGPQHGAEKTDAYGAHKARAGAVLLNEARADDHLHPGTPQRFVDAGNVGGVVLAVTVQADHVFVAELVCQLVASLHAAAQAKVMGQRQDARSGVARDLDGSVQRAVIDDQNGHAGHNPPDIFDDAANGLLLVIRR